MYKHEEWSMACEEIVSIAGKSLKTQQTGNLTRRKQSVIRRKPKEKEPKPKARVLDAY